MQESQIADRPGLAHHLMALVPLLSTRPTLAIRLPRMLRDTVLENVLGMALVTATGVVIEKTPV